MSDVKEAPEQVTIVRMMTFRGPWRLRVKEDGISISPMDQCIDYVRLDLVHDLLATLPACKRHPSKSIAEHPDRPATRGASAVAFTSSPSSPSRRVRRGTSLCAWLVPRRRPSSTTRRDSLVCRSRMILVVCKRSSWMAP